MLKVDYDDKQFIQEVLVWNAGETVFVTFIRQSDEIKGKHGYYRWFLVYNHLDGEFYKMTLSSWIQDILERLFITKRFEVNTTKCKLRKVLTDSDRIAYESELQELTQQELQTLADKIVLL